MDFLLDVTPSYQYVFYRWSYIYIFIYSHNNNHKEQYRMIWQGCQKQLFNVIEEMTERNKKHLWGKVGYICGGGGGSCDTCVIPTWSNRIILATWALVIRW